MEWGPGVLNITDPGLVTLLVAGVPPAKVQEILLIVLPPLPIDADGLIVTEPQAPLKGPKLSVGGVFIVMVCDTGNVPQPLVTFKVMVYVPAIVKLKAGFTDDALPVLNNQPEAGLTLQL